MKIIFTGDFSISGIFLDSVIRKKPILDNKIIDIFKNSDFVHINLENPITNQDFRKKKGSSLKAPTNVISYLKEYNINICSLANNHIMDCGESGLLDTISLLNENNIKNYGIGPYKKYIIISDKDVSIALISSCSKDGPIWNGTNIAPFGFNLKEIKLIIDTLKANKDIDFIIYNYHGGTEFNLVPEPKRREFFKALIDLGIDLVIGHHAHVPQGIEYINKQIIIYGLGNFCFDTPYQRSKHYTSESYFVDLIIDKNQISIKEFCYKIDIENGIVMFNTNPNLYNILRNANNILKNKKLYENAWLEDCFRLYMKPLIKNNDERKGNGKNIGKKTNNIFLRLFLLVNTFAYDLRNENRRIYIIGSLIYIFKRAFNKL